ncbi:MAG: aminotransferase class V-fold PLP-dependent enzyme [Candidatus Cloacimonetes bacterium]|nr:aminotransferase class V-fold PLP-dependent enzyme [Candidatus Cloacimonadota bacterium]
MDKKQISEIINELGEENFSYDPVSVPIYQTSSFLFGSFDELKRAVSSEKDAYLYTRGNNPTCEVVEKKIAALENGEKAKLFASGVAAISASVMSLLKTGDHVVCVRDCYSWSYKLFSRYLSRFGIEVTFIDGVNITDWKNSIRSNTKLFYLESPTTFTFFLQDLTAVSNLAKENKIKTIIDNTWATPIFQNPLQFGIDLVVHSCSKYIGGHSDVVAGVVVGNTKEIEHIFNTELLNIGGILRSFNRLALLRGIRTLSVLM